MLQNPNHLVSPLLSQSSIPVFPTEVSWPLLDTRCSPEHFYCSLFLGGQRKIRRDRLLSNYHHGQNWLNLGKLDEFFTNVVDLLEKSNGFIKYINKYLYKNYNRLIFSMYPLSCCIIILEIIYFIHIFKVVCHRHRTVLPFFHKF